MYEVDKVKRKIPFLKFALIFVAIALFLSCGEKGTGLDGSSSNKDEIKIALDSSIEIAVSWEKNEYELKSKVDLKGLSNITEVKLNGTSILDGFDKKTGRINTTIKLSKINEEDFEQVDVYVLSIVTDKDKFETEVRIIRTRPQIRIEVDSKKMFYPDSSSSMLVIVTQGKGQELDSLWLGETAMEVTGDSIQKTWKVQLTLGKNNFKVIATNKLGSKSTFTTSIYYSGVDTDGDGVSDADEKRLGTDPKDSLNLSIIDSDGDGISDSIEVELGTDVNNADTDGDGISDGKEVLEGGDPTDNTDGNINPTDTTLTGQLGAYLPHLKMSDTVQVLEVLKDASGKNKKADIVAGLMSGLGISITEDPLLEKYLEQTLYNAKWKIVKGNTSSGLKKASAGSAPSELVITGENTEFKKMEIRILSGGLYKVRVAFSIEGGGKPGESIHPGLSFMDPYSYGALVVLITTYETKEYNFSYVPMPQNNQLIKTGLHLFAIWDLKNTAMQDYLKLDQAVLYALIPAAKNMLEVELNFILGFNVPLGEIGMFKEARLRLMLDEEAKKGVKFLNPFKYKIRGASIHLLGKFEVQVQDDLLEFIAKADFQPKSGFTMSSTMTGLWRNPLGIENFTIDSVALEAGWSWITQLPTIGIAGQVVVADHAAFAAVKFDSRNPFKSIIGGGVKGKLSLKDIVSNWTDPKILGEIQSGDLKGVVVDLSIEDPELYLAKENTRIGEIDYKAGLRLKGTGNFFGLQTIYDVQIDAANGLKIIAKRPPLIFLRDVFEIKGSSNGGGGKDDSVTIDIQLWYGKDPAAHVNIKGLMTFLTVTSEGALSINDKGFKYHSAGDIYGFGAEFDLYAGPGDVNDAVFSGRIGYQADLLNYIDKAVTNRVANQVKEATDSIGAAKDKVSEAHNALERDKAKVTQSQKDVDKAQADYDKAIADLAKAKKDLEEAKAPVTSAQKDVDKLNGDISRLQSKIDSKNKTAADYEDDESCTGGDCVGSSCATLTDPLCWDSCAWRTPRVCVPDLVSRAKAVPIRAEVVVLEAEKLTLIASRDVAKGVLEGVKGTLTATQGVLTGAQLVVEQSKITLEVAKAALEVGRAALIVSQGVLVAAEAVLEATKVTYGAMGSVAVFVLDKGLPALVSVKKAGISFGSLDVLKGQLVLDVTIDWKEEGPKEHKVAFKFGSEALTSEIIADLLLGLIDETEALIGW